MGALALGWSTSARAADDDELIVIDDAAPVDADGVVRFDTDPGDDDTIVIVDDTAVPLPVAPKVTGSLGRLWETWHIAADSEVLGQFQTTEAADGPWRAQAATWIESWLLPTQNLSVYASALGRVGFDSTPEGLPWGWFDLYDASARINVDRATVQLGRLVIPWGRTQAAAFGDRLHPPDLRRGGAFPDAARQKQPQLGAQVKGSLDVVGVEGVAFVSYEPSEGALTAANQGGVRIARYQTALARSPARASGLLVDDDTSRLRALPRLANPTFAGRVWRRVGDIDVTASATWQFDDTPTLLLAPDVARALAAEALTLRGAPQQPTPPPCGGDTSLRCIGGRDTLTYDRTTTLGLDASWGLGLVVVRAEAVAWPLVAGQGGKSALVVDDDGVRSVKTSLWQGALAVEGQLGPAVDGSLELFDVMWDGVPRAARLWGVEVLRPDDQRALDAAGDGALRQVHRLAAAASLGGALFDERVRWRLRGEAGLLQPDVLASAEVRFRLPAFDLYVGGRGDLFSGFPGSPGWMRQDASNVGVFLGEGS